MLGHMSSIEGYDLLHINTGVILGVLLLHIGLVLGQIDEPLPHNANTVLDCFVPIDEVECLWDLVGCSFHHAGLFIHLGCLSTFEVQEVVVA